MKKRNPAAQANDTLALAGVAGQAGVVTLIIVAAALVLGLWLDRQLGSRPVMTILLVLISVPLSLWLMIRTVLSSMARFHAQRGNQPVEPGAPIGGTWRRPAQDDDEDDDEDDDDSNNHSAEGGRQS